MSKRLVDHTDLELLSELLSRHKVQVGPFRTVWSEQPLNAIIGIGKDHHADLYIGKEDYDKLKELTSDNSPAGGSDIPHSDR